MQPDAAQGLRPASRLGFHLTISTMYIQIHEKPTSRRWCFSPKTPGRKYAVGAFFDSLFCFVSISFSPSIKKRTSYPRIVGGCIQSLSNWPEVRTPLFWIPRGKGSLPQLNFSRKKLAGEEGFILLKSKLILSSSHKLSGKGCFDYKGRVPVSPAIQHSVLSDSMLVHCVSSQAPLWC